MAHVLFVGGAIKTTELLNSIQATEMMQQMIDSRENQVLKREVCELYFARFPADLTRKTCVK